MNATASAKPLRHVFKDLVPNGDLARSLPWCRHKALRQLAAFEFMAAS